MNSNLIHTLPSNRRMAPAPVAPAASADSFRQPAYDSQDTPGSMKLTVYVPGVDAAGVEIEGHGADLTVTALKHHFVRTNFGAQHLERAQRDYRLRLRLGARLDFAHMQAEIADGVLTITVPKRSLRAERVHLRRVA